jgi:hypothetical protein
MKVKSSAMHQKSLLKIVLPSARSLLAIHIALLIALSCTLVLAQKKQQQKLPSPEKIVDNYLKAIGGKKRVAAIKDTSFEWAVMEQGQPVGNIQVRTKAPAAVRVDVHAGSVESTNAVNSSTVWEEVSLNNDAANKKVQTLTGVDANVAKIESLLLASRFVNYKKLNLLARTVMLDESGSEPAYVVEFSSRNGARLRCWFGQSSKLLLKIERGKTHSQFADYRAEQGILEPHRMEGNSIALSNGQTLVLQSVRYNTGLSDALFDPPGGAEPIDIGALLREVDRNQEQVEERVGDYTYTEKRTERKINGRGEVTEEIVRVYEIYPIPNRESVRKLISENGVPLSAEKAAKEEKRVTEELEKAQQEREKAAQKRARELERQKGKPAKEEEDDVGIADFLRAAEMVSPRREKLRERDAIVFDFRPRVGYKPKNSTESIISKLTGIMWIDPVDKQVMRLEARLVESYKMGGGLLASVRPGTAFVFEQKRMDDGVWLPVFSQVNVSAKILLFKSLDLNIMQEFSNYQKFNSSFDDYKLTTPENKTKPPSNP